MFGKKKKNKEADFNSIRDETEAFNNNLVPVVNNTMSVEDIWSSIDSHLNTVMERHKDLHCKVPSAMDQLKRLLRRTQRSWSKAKKTI